VLIFLNKNRNILKEIHFNIQPRNALWVVLLAVCMLPGMTFLSAVTAVFFTNIVSEFVGGLDVGFLPALLLVALLPALCEEFLMRGVMLEGHRADGASRKSIAIAGGILFAIIHMNPQQFLYALFAGITLALLVYVTRSVAYSMLAHFLLNTVSVVALYIVSPALENVLASKAVEPPGIDEATAASLNTSAQMGVVVFLFILFIFSIPVIRSILVKLKKNCGGTVEVSKLQHPFEIFFFASVVLFILIEVLIYL